MHQCVVKAYMVRGISVLHKDRGLCLEPKFFCLELKGRVGDLNAAVEFLIDWSVRMNTTIERVGVWGDTWQTERNFSEVQVNAKPARTNEEIRASYNKQVTEAFDDFVEVAAAFHDNEQCFGDGVARLAFEKRDEIKKAHQEETSWLGQAAIFVRNMFLYGSPNATYEVFSRKKNPEEIAYAAFKTNGSDLGLNGNGFGDVLDTWRAIKNVSTIYPEAITPEMVAAFKAQAPGKVDPALILAAGKVKTEEMLPKAQSLSELMVTVGIPASSRRSYM